MSLRAHLRVHLPLAVLVLLVAAAATPFVADAQPASPDAPAADACADPTVDGTCHNVPKALRLKLIAIPTILVASVIGVCLPLFSRYVPALRPDRNLFVIVKAFASGVILATGYMHVLPDSFNNLTSPCLPKKPWGEFPFTAFVAMLAALFTLMVDSLMLTFYSRSSKSDNTSGAAVADHESPAHGHWHSHGHGHGDIVAAESAAVAKPEDDESSKVQLRRNRVVVQVLEMGIIVHSVVIGLGMGASQNVCTIRPLVAAMCFHQLFEGMGLGGCILQAEYGLKMKSGLVFFFSTTTPFGIALGLALTKVYRENSPTALVVVGLLNAASAGLLHYMALVELLAADFMGPKLQGSVRLQLLSFLAVLLGAGGMSIMANLARSEMSSQTPRRVTLFTLLVLTTSSLAVTTFAQTEPEAPPTTTHGVCGGPAVGGKCHSVPRALRLKLIAIPAILVASMGGVCLPLVSRSVPALRPDGNLFVVVKAFASGVILGTGYMHVLPDSFNDLSSPCLPRRPWAEFPFTAFVAMLAAVFTLMVDSLMLTFHSRGKGKASAAVHGHESPPVGHCHGHGHVDMSEPASPEDVGKVEGDVEAAKTKLRRNRVIVQVLEMGIVVHSVVIGLGMGASQNVCTIRPLVAALCFHQFFEGMGLGGCILQAEYGARMKSVLVFFFSTTTPFGIALGLGLTKVYSDSSPTALIVVGLLNAASAGLLHYMALVDLLAADFMGPRLQGSVRLQLVSFLAVLLGAGGMSIMAKWA
ncbi:Fe(2+) transport protein 2 [Dichanthelium oligosanthes]|uniref:Fe(2+) transport protein 2 n=1 Tax=Dichanthelium oligosanthes TaxID=888268 RepID=A0A1E5VY15_9POAL|nr:Fe(2+) transport protein 2 [Dichanthelium oligosanthes]